jgi:16S rRNA processing protein RimM
VVKQTESDWIVVGRFGRVHGIKGLILMHSFTDPVENIFSYEPLSITIKKEWRPIRLIQKQISGDKLLVHVENYSTREDASFLTNMEIAVPRHVLPKLDEDIYYLHDLIELDVFNLKNEYLGKISDIMPTGANDVLVISGNTRILVPFIWHVYIKNIDIEAQKMLIDWEMEVEEK